MKAQRGVDVQFYSFFNLSVVPGPLYPRKTESVPIVWEAGWNSGPVWTGVENLAPIGIRSPDRPPRSESLYRLLIPAHIITLV